MNNPLRSMISFRWFEQRLVWHPLLFAMAPVLSLVGHNLLEIHPLAGLRSLLLLLITTTIILIVLQRWIHEKQRAAMLCSLFLLLFFSYGHVYYGLVSESTHGLFSRVGLIGNHITLGLTWLALFIASVWITIRAQTRMTTLTQVMNLMALVTVLVPIIQIVRFEIQRGRPIPGRANSPATQEADISVDKPDIYYLILDGYGREDILRELYSFDNAGFIEFLQQQGFSIIPQARSNYVQTSLSVTTSMNMDYLPEMLSTVKLDGDPRLTLSRLIRNNRVMELLEKQGYQSIAFASGYRPTELRNAGQYLSPLRWSVNPLEGLLLETSAFAAFQALADSMGLPGYYPGYSSHRELIQYTLNALPETAKLPGPKFVFAHIVIPHPPFVFESSGEATTPNVRFSFMDGDAFQGTEEEYLEGYRAQLTFLNGQLRTGIKDILQNSNRPTIIILQGDHGPGLGLDYHSYEGTNLDERTAILQAIRIPEGADVKISPTLSPVNTFRLVLGLQSGTEFQLLADRSYYSTWSDPLEFIPVEFSDLN